MVPPALPPLLSLELPHAVRPSTAAVTIAALCVKRLNFFCPSAYFGVPMSTECHVLQTLD
ncbi:hypothetical protein [Alloactinosynnema sp. L-07]|nr:hypothetical protein [Alloactinosynnema sp. L-07]